jgi:hypothetical protein
LAGNYKTTLFLKVKDDEYLSFTFVVLAKIAPTTSSTGGPPLGRAWPIGQTSKFRGVSPRHSPR